MISRRTIFSFLLALLLAGGLWTWSLGHRDDCDRIHKGEEATIDVKSGKNLYAVPCSFWVPRQPVAVQVLSLLDGSMWLVFLITAGGDWMRFRARERQWLV